MFTLLRSKEDIDGILCKDTPSNNLANKLINQIKMNPLVENIQAKHECSFDDQMEAILLIENWCELHCIEYANVGYLENGLEIIGLRKI